MKFKRGINKNQEFLFAKKPEDFLPEEPLAKIGNININAAGNFFHC